MRNFLFILVAFLTLGVSAQQKTFNSDVKINGDLTVKKATPIIKLDNTSNSGDITVGSLTTPRTWTLPDASGTLALTSDIPGPSTFVPYTGATGPVDLGFNTLRGLLLEGFILEAKYTGIPVVRWSNTSTGDTVELVPNTSPTINNYQVELPDATGILALNTTSKAKTITGTGSKLILDNSSMGDQEILFQPTGSTDWFIKESTPFFNTSLIIGARNGGDTNYMTFSDSNLITSDILFRFGADVEVGNTSEFSFISGSYNGAFSVETLTTDRTWTLQDATGTLALTSDIPSYAEGTFTPTLTDTGGGATYSGTMEGEYIRTGNLVNFNIALSGLSTSGTPTGFLQIGNLPFAVDNLSVGSAACPVNQLEGIDVNYYSAVGSVIDSSDAIRIVITTSASSEFVTLSSATFTSGIIVVSGTYKTNVYTP